MHMSACTKADPEFMRRNAKAMARQLRLIADELDRQGVQLCEGTVVCMSDMRPASLEGYHVQIGAKFVDVHLSMRYFDPGGMRPHDENEGGH